jgi:hypothetical protein
MIENFGSILLLGALLQALVVIVPSLILVRLFGLLELPKARLVAPLVVAAVASAITYARTEGGGMFALVYVPIGMVMFLGLLILGPPASTRPRSPAPTARPSGNEPSQAPTAPEQGSRQ